jgi:hypothetical protein
MGVQHKGCRNGELNTIFSHVQFFVEISRFDEIVSLDDIVRVELGILKPSGL